MSLEDIIQTVYTGQLNEIDLWDKLVQYFVQYWDGEPDIFQQVRDLSRKQLGSQIDNIATTSDYFSALENNFSDKNDLLEFVINLTGYLNYHSELGSINVKESLQKCRKKLREFRQICIKRGIFKDTHFVGREDEILQMKKEIRIGKKRGILLSGMGGMGKTCLANAVCYDMRQEDWKTTKVELREQRTFRHFLRTTLNSIKDLRGLGLDRINTTENTEEDDKLPMRLVGEEVMQQRLIDYFTEKQNSRKQIYMFDNIDDATTDPLEKEKIMQLFKTLLSISPNNSECQMRIIITSRENFLLICCSYLKMLMMAIEVKSLNHHHAVELVKKCTRQTNLTKAEMDSVVRVCWACPLAIRVLSDMLTYAPRTVISELENKVKYLSTSFLQLDHCLQEPYERLDNYKYTLCKLSLFGTAKFDLKSATIVIFGKKSSKDETVENQKELQMILLLFKSRHLIEIENTDRNESYETYPNIEREHTEYNIFSLHPLVYKFLTERSKDKDVFSEIMEAKCNYLSLYNELVIEIGTTYDSDVLLAREKCEKQRVHISKYFQLLEEHDEILSLSYLKNVLSAEEAKSMSNVVEMIHLPESHLSFLQSMCSRSGHQGLSKCSWEIEHVTCMIKYGKPCENIDELYNDIINQLDSLSAEEFNEIDNEQLLILRGRMLLNKGSILMDMCDGEEPMKVLRCAEEVFKSKCLSGNIDCKLYLAQIYNCIGCIYFRSREIDKSIRMHEKALTIHCESKCRNESTLDFYANIGACHYHLGIQHNRDGDKSMFKKEMKNAIKYYSDSLNIALHLKLGMTNGYVKKLRNRGNVYIMLSKFDDAENDYKEGLRIIKTLFATPSRLEILLRHGLGDACLWRLKQRRPDRKSGCTFSYSNEEETGGLDVTWLDEGVRIYDAITKKMNPEILPTDDYYYNKIKDNHLYFAKQLHEGEEKAKTFYQTYGACEIVSHSGDHSSSSSSDNADESDESQSPPSTQQTLSHPSGADDKQVHRIHSKPGIEVQEPPSHHEDQEVTNPESTTDNRKTPINESIGEQKRNFKLPLTSLRKSSQSIDSPSSGFPLKMTTQRGSSSSSGVSSMGSNTPDLHYHRRDSRSMDSNKGESFESDVFPLKDTCVDKRREHLSDPGWSNRRTSLNSFGSGSLESGTTGDHQSDIIGSNQSKITGKKRKLDTEQKPPIGKSASFSDFGHPKLTKQSSQDWMLKHKLSPSFEDQKNHKSSQTEGGNLDLIVDELQVLMPSTEPRMGKLIRQLHADTAHLVDDDKGRPTVQYDDEGLGEEVDDNAEM